ncbi:unnamed protein product [Adineta ricciae]|uniref:Uncharacterized protein n=1 Tax=Adineta ricciae TaxID=249248 RepID=A0A815C2J3_ADIRI|nr:unnamed protein product [Adineta ricciae]
MADTSSSLRMYTPEQTNRLQGLKSRRRSISISLHETTTPALKSISSLDHADCLDTNTLLTPHENSDLLSAYDKLTTWKRTVEKHLNRIYLHKLKEIDNLVANGQTQVDITFGAIPSFEQLAKVTLRQQITDHTYDNIEFNHDLSQSFDLFSNNILLCTSDHEVLAYDDTKSKMILYNEKSFLNSFDWDTDEYGDPCDLSYSDYLDVYCIITNRGLFTWSSEDSSVPLHIDSIKPIAANRLWTMASTDSRADVFVLFKLGSYIERWNSIIGTKSWQPIHRWSNHDLFERNDQRIRSIRMTSTYVAWTVESTKTSEWRVDLLDYQLQVIRHGINIDHLDKYSSCLLSNFGPEHFLITDSNCHLLFLLDSQGRTTLKTDSLLAKRIRNSVLMNNNNQQWLVVRLERPNQLYFIALTDRKETLDKII